MKDLIKIAFLGILGMALLIPMKAHGLIITYEFDLEISEAQAPSGPTPWVTATFNDEFNDLNEVLLTVSAVNLTEEESITGLLFNFHPDYDPGLLTFTPVDNSASVPNGIFTGADSYRGGRAGYFDILFDQPPPTPGNSEQHFIAGEQIVYIIGYDSEDYEINAGSFNFESVGGSEGENYNAVAKIQRISDMDYSGWIAPQSIPEPATVLLLGSLLIGIGVLKRKS